MRVEFKDYRSMNVVLQALPGLNKTSASWMMIEVLGDWVYVYYIANNGVGTNKNISLCVYKLDDPIGWEKRDNVIVYDDDETGTFGDLRKEHTYAITLASLIKMADGETVINPEPLIQGLLKLGVDVRGWKLTSNYLTHALTFEVKQENSSTMNDAESFLGCFMM